MKKKTAVILILCVFALALAGCKGKSEFTKGMEFYELSDFEQADVCFSKALNEENVKPEAVLAYGFNKVCLSQYEECCDRILPLFENGQIKDTETEKKQDMFFLLAYSYYKLKDYRQSVNFYKELKLITNEPDVRDNIDCCILEAYKRLCYGELEDIGQAALDYEDMCTYILQCDKSLSGSLFEFMTGMSIYMYDNSTEPDRTDKAYLDRAEDYLSRADRYEDGVKRNLEKYGIIIAERRGKTDVAYKLLDVFLAHYPDDEGAANEQLFLLNRMGGEL